MEGKPSPWTLPRTAFNLQGTLPFLFAIFACFAVKITTDTPFEFLELRTKRTARTRASSSFTALGSHLGGEGNLLLGLFLEPLSIYSEHAG